MKKILFYVFLWTQMLLGQNKVDSLLKLLSSNNDTLNANIYNQLSILLSNTNPEKSLEYTRKILEIGNSKNLNKYKAIGNFRLGYYYQIKSELDSAILFYNQAISLSKISSDKKLEAQTRKNLGIILVGKGEFEKAILQYQSASALYTEIKEIKGNADIKNNIGVVYLQQKDFKNAEKFFKTSIEEMKPVYKVGMLGPQYLNLAIIASNSENFKETEMFYKKSFIEYSAANNLSGLSLCYNGLFLNYLNTEKIDSAYRYNQLMTNLARSADDKENLYLSYINFSILNQRYSNNYEIARQYIDSAKSIHEVYSLPTYRMVNFQEYATYYFNTKNKKEGYRFMDKFLNLRDSIISNENSKAVSELQTKYETEKKDLQIAQQKSDLNLKESESERKSVIIWLSLTALIGTGFFGTMAFINFKKTQQAKKVIEGQKKQVELQKEEITHQKELVDEKQKEIIDSINYAMRIQSAVLTGEDVWSKVSKEHFILFKPKDIVSGDFYWAYNTPNNRSVFVLADCTGHGVPGGFMSMLGNSFLNEIVVENKIFKADEILNKLRAKTINALEQKGGTQQKDGMDMALCVWNKIDNTLEFAGANNPLWVLRGIELKEYKANKMPIGAFTEDLPPFKSQIIQLEKGDAIYMITDGFADQFGGPKGKKFKYKALQELLIGNTDKPMFEQKIILEGAINDWKKGYEQIDDISLIGIRV